MKTGDLVKVIENDMSLILPVQGPKNNRFFDQIGIVLGENREDCSRLYGHWWFVKFPAGLYEARSDAVEVINEVGS
jgi:hypothetical protein